MPDDQILTYGPVERREILRVFESLQATMDRADVETEQFRPPLAFVKEVAAKSEHGASMIVQGFGLRQRQRIFLCMGVVKPLCEPITWDSEGMANATRP